jgi:outer membrane usher protein
MAISDPSGKALALVEEDYATLIIKWDGKQCQAPYSLPERNKSLNYERVRLMCKP